MHSTLALPSLSHTCLSNFHAGEHRFRQRRRSARSLVEEMQQELRSSKSARTGSSLKVGKVAIRKEKINIAKIAKGTENLKQLGPYLRSRYSACLSPEKRLCCANTRWETFCTSEGYLFNCPSTVSFQLDLCQVFLHILSKIEFGFLRMQIEVHSLLTESHPKVTIDFLRR